MALSHALRIVLLIDRRRTQSRSKLHKALITAVQKLQRSRKAQEFREKNKKVKVRYFLKRCRKIPKKLRQQKILLTWHQGNKTKISSQLLKPVNQLLTLMSHRQSRSRYLTYTPHSSIPFKTSGRLLMSKSKNLRGLTICPQASQSSSNIDKLCLRPALCLVRSMPALSP